MPVYKRGDHYHIRFQVKGRRVSETCKGGTYEQAKALEAKIRQDIIADTLGQASYTIEDALARWLDSEARNLKSYTKILQTVSLIREHISDTPLLKAADAAQRIREAYAHLDPATVNRRLAILRRVVNLAWEWQWIKSPIKIKLLPGEKSRHTYLTIQEVIKLSKHAGRSKWHVILAAFSGMRQREILNLREEDINFGSIIAHETKNGKPRLIPLNAIAQGAADRMDLDVTYEVLRREFERAREICGLEVRFHDLRHTAASFMVNGGAGMTAIRDVLGHCNLSVTSRYAHLAIGDMKIAVDKMINGTKTVQNKLSSKPSMRLIGVDIGARGRNRTGTTVKSRDFKSLSLVRKKA
jgi:integrase